MISCPTCGVVLNEAVAPFKVATFKGDAQISIYCPVCFKLVARSIDGEEVKVTSGKAPPVVAAVVESEPE